MKAAVLRLHHGQAWAIAGLMVLLPGLALAHERFIKHDILRPLHREFFRRLDPNMLDVAVRIAALLAVMLFIWFLRNPLDNFIENRLLWRLQGRAKRWVHLIASFVTDKPVDHPWFKKVGEWVVILFLRSPALVLMFSAVNDSLVMPSYPLEPSTALVFKYAQVVMAMGIITQAFLPFGGATIFGTFVYLLYAFDWKIAVDVLPVLTAAVIYVSSPWYSHKQIITSVTPRQMRWVRLTLGFGFVALGWMKLYNHDLTAGVADNYPSVLEDPLIKMFYAGTDPAYHREAWIVAFGLTEVLTGFLIMVGAFTRVWSVMMVYVFTKLMVIDFGWAEIPHLYPIGAFLVVMFSNSHSDEFYQIEEMEEYQARKGKTGFQILIALVGSVLIAALVIFPMLYLLTRVEHP
ncbi:MAG TPA: hypothetical protein VFR64_20250 [Methylomirabilota bacterium]|nr:hypothetical protein [Methylomirabilota bacterium]